MNALATLARQLREEQTPISPHVVDPGEPGGFDLPDEYALVVEAVREGYLLHYGEPRLLRGQDADLALLAGDYLYALGIERLAALGDTESVAHLAELIGGCARFHAEDRAGDAAKLWQSTVAAIVARAT